MCRPRASAVVLASTPSGVTQPTATMCLEVEKVLEQEKHEAGLSFAEPSGYCEVHKAEAVKKLQSAFMHW